MTGPRIRDFVPIVSWLPAYGREDLGGDLNAGAITAIMLVPQGMAYALLAGLPPEMGLYSSILPLVLYGVFGTSRTLAVGPVALVSLMVAGTIGELAQTMPERVPEAPLALALLVGLISVVMGLLRVGFVVNFISHHVISGFTSAAALIIGLSQLKHLMGVDIPRTHNVVRLLGDAFTQISNTNVASLSIGIGAVLILLFFRAPLGRILETAGIGKTPAQFVARSGPLLVVILATFAVFGSGLGGPGGAGGVAIVGAIPQGLPPFAIPSLDLPLMQALLGPAFLISFVGFLESVSVAKALASRRRQKIGPNRELVGLGMANIAAAFSGGYPVTGGFSRSSVNFSAGANTPVASFITAAIVALTALLLTPLFFYLPKTVLAAIIMVAVFGLIDVKTFIASWRYSVCDALSLLGTFLAVFALGVEGGIIAGVGISIFMHLWRASRPHVAIVGRVPGTEHFRNYLRHDVLRSDDVSAVRIDESLFFANAAWLENWVISHIADYPRTRHLVLICAAINFIDGSALEILERLDEEMQSACVTLHLAEVKGPVMDRLKAAGFAQHLGEARIHISTHAAMMSLGVPD